MSVLRPLNAAVTIGSTGNHGGTIRNQPEWSVTNSDRIHPAAHRGRAVAWFAPQKAAHLLALVGRAAHLQTRGQPRVRHGALGTHQRGDGTLHGSLPWEADEFSLAQPSAFCPLATKAGARAGLSRNHAEQLRSAKRRRTEHRLPACAVRRRPACGSPLTFE